MTVRTAELLMGLIMAALSVYFMYYAYKLPIGWIEDEGPGGGFWPFWLSAAMFLSCLGILWNWFRKNGAIATSTERFMPPGVTGNVGIVAFLLFLTIAAFEGIGPIPGVGVYVAIPVFMFIYIKILGKNGWGISLAMSLLSPVFLFLFFEIALKITLPKGITEPLFYPLYSFFFG